MSDQHMAFVGTSSNINGCPTLFITARGTLVVQGTTVTDPAALEVLRSRGDGMPAHESAVEIPAALLPFIDIEALQRIAFADEDRPDFVIDPASAEKLEQLADAVRR